MGPLQPAPHVWDKHAPDDPGNQTEQDGSDHDSPLRKDPPATLLMRRAPTGSDHGDHRLATKRPFSQGPRRRAALRDVQRVAQPQRRRASWSSVLSTPGNPQVANVAEIIQRVRPDVLLINEFDYDAGGRRASCSSDNYLGVSQNGAAPIHYPYRFVAPVQHRHRRPGIDLDNDGTITARTRQRRVRLRRVPRPVRAWPSTRAPDRRRRRVRTFQHFLWKDMPGALLPDDPATPAPADWYSPDELDVFRLSSKSHWDVPIEIGRRTGALPRSATRRRRCSTAPEDRNGTRNHDEIRFWADYVSPAAGGYIYDDEGGRGGLRRQARFVIAGDQNADPLDGDSIPGRDPAAARQPADQHEQHADQPGRTAAGRAAGRRERHARRATRRSTPPTSPTRAPGNLRADYVLPDKRTRHQEVRSCSGR